MMPRVLLPRGQKNLLLKRYSILTIALLDSHHGVTRYTPAQHRGSRSGTMPARPFCAIRFLMVWYVCREIPNSLQNCVTVLPSRTGSKSAIFLRLCNGIAIRLFHRGNRPKSY